MMIEWMSTPSRGALSVERSSLEADRPGVALVMNGVEREGEREQKGLYDRYHLGD